MVETLRLRVMCDVVRRAQKKGPIGGESHCMAAGKPF